MLIRSQEVNVLPPAPEFDRSGCWPPIATGWLPLRWELFDAEASNLRAYAAYEIASLPIGDDDVVRLVPDRGGYHRSMKNVLLYKEDALSAHYPYKTAFSRIAHRYSVARGRPGTEYFISGAQTYNGSQIDEFMLFRIPADGTAKPPTGSRELRRLVHETRWRRENPVMQLPPSSTHEVTHSISTGFSVEQTQTLASSLGISNAGNVVSLQTKISSRLNQEFGFKLDVSSQEQRTTRLALANPADNYYRLYALWHVDQRIRVEAREVPLVTADRRHGLNFPEDQLPIWMARGVVEFVTSSEPFITFKEEGRL